MRRNRRKGGNKEKVFGCDLLEHLTATSQEIPQVLRCCSEFVEHHGIVDGIYRLSGVSSNIQKLRNEFENDANPDLNKDVYLQDIHCVSSLCKAYFRELPNPLLTYQLYDKFAEAVAIQLEEERLVKIKDVLKELPSQHYRTLEFLMCHLVKMASFSSETNMHARNLAIVWAPNLLRSKDIEATGFNGTAAFMEVRVQSIVVEFILTHVSQLFPEQGVSSERRNSLPSPSAMPIQAEGLFKSIPTHPHANYGNLSPGDGPLPIRPYHAIIEGTDKRKGSLKGRKWMSIFNIGGRFPDPRRRHKHSAKEKERPTLRPARSMDSLSSPCFPEGARHPSQRPPSTNMSPLVAPSTQSGSEAPAPTGAMGGSEYAVTYRRGTGLVSGGAGVQGTYTALDPEGLGLTSNDVVQSRSPGLSTKVGRRAAMHITGPTIVTVPLHITSNLALGVLQGGGGDRIIHRARDKDGGDRVECKEGGEKVERQESGETERKVEEVRKVGEEDKNHRGGETDREGVMDGEEDTVADIASEEKVGEKEEEEKEEEKEEDVREEWKLKQRPKSLTSNVEEDNDDHREEDQDVDENSEYMEMKEFQSEVTHRDNDCALDASDVLNSTEVEEDDHELSGYVQDSFEFLDHMDCSVPYQVNEFSVEPPGHWDDDYEVMEQAQAYHHPAELQKQLQPDPETHTQSQTQLNSHRPLSLDIDSRHAKSLSLPYMTSPIHGPEESEESEEEYSDDHEYNSEEDEHMFMKSLPADFILNDYETHSCTLDEVPVDQSKRESESLHPEYSACEETTAGDQEQGEIKDEEEGEGDKDGQEREEVTKKEEEDTVHQGRDQPERNMQSRATEVDLSATEDAWCDEVKLPPSEASTHCCVEFPLPRIEDTDESSTMADTKADEENEVVDNLHSDYPPCDTDSCDTQKETADVSAASRDFSERATEQFNSCVIGGKKEGEGDDGEDRKIDKEIEDICRERERKESRSETTVDIEMALEIKQSDEGMYEEPTGGDSEEIADKKHEEKMEENGKQQHKALCKTSCKIWDELEDVICEVIEDEESKQGERKGVRDGVEEGAVVEDVDQIAMVFGEKMAKVEEKVINKTEDKIEVVEEPRETAKEKHKDAETQQEFEEKETYLPKRSELGKEIQEKHVGKEEAQDHDREEVEHKENNDKDKANEQLTFPPSIDKKDKRQKEVKSNIRESKEGWKCEESQGGVGRKLVISKQSPIKIYQVKAVPVVPPKPQHCKMTALTIRQQQQERERRDAACMLKVPTEGEQGKDGDLEHEGKGKKELLRVGEKDRERRRDGDEGATRDTARNSPLSLCFDEAVAMVTMRREKEKECEKEKERQRDWGSEVQ
ncbi:rho GTPase-activating protein 30 isoform X1 [Thunnus maccoyii]|uniref:rho GTPase-activating protein 30 isoform X1 n=1 Tax=Thunnus maccoyii TaxID=8240 RepID=UPI001C4C85DE|nr:rho GTPase-activating protein 30 isoform X1 [Thunnus maccoyii]XP_042283416.1 rho GTPase-activating protein 30 isoform X1 [Thunnus maccoyii]XP_042283417.1 rho GTPase-activating protein 30 isoform X1 [Thunnus maccoyii]